MDSLLNQLAASVSNAEDLEGLTRPILQLLETVTGLESTYLTTVDAQRGVQHILYSRNVRELQIPEGLSVPWEDTLCRRALVEDRPYTDDVAGVWGDSNAAKALGIKTYMSHPVRNLDGGLYGTLCAASDVSRPVSPEVLKVLGMFASLISHQVERERLFNNLRKANETLAAEATTDPLTGVGNRRALIAELKRTLARAHRDGDAVRVAFVDLDGFKRINDVYGHEVGDRFLELLASRLVAGTRSGDFVGRYGGDEFVVLSMHTESQEGLRARIERLTIGRYLCGAIDLDYAGASVGITVSEPGETEPEPLLARADAAMFAVKKARKAERVH